MKYRREIDGLRAVAVLPVIFFHAGFEAFSGGFVGVDIFFVISGYLITTIILQDMEEGRFSILTFYERRARRILPALFFVVLCCFPFAYLFLLPDHMKDFSQSLIAVSLFSSNVLFWKESGYFDNAAELKPLLHTWSLSVEEQYYVIFPLFLMILWKFRRRWIFSALMILAAASLALAQWGAFYEPTATFYLLPARFWELAIGALIAFYFLYRENHISFIRSVDWINELCSLCGISLIVASVVMYDRTTPFPSLYALLPIIGSGLIILFSTTETVVGRALASKIMVGIGLISYSTYLWHQPLFVFSRHRFLDEPGAIYLVSLSLLSIMLGYLSWRFIENPFRDKRVFSRKIIFRIAVVGSFAFIIIGAFGVLNEGYAGRFDIEGFDLESFKKHSLRRECDKNNDESGRDVKFCTLGSDAIGAQKIAVFGDSHSVAMLPAFDAAGKESNYSVVHNGLAGCPPLLGVDVARGYYGSGVCREMSEKQYKYVVDNNVEKVFLVARWSLYTDDEYEKKKDKNYLIEFDGDVLSKERTRELFEKSVKTTLESYGKIGIKPYIIFQVPQQKVDPKSLYHKIAVNGKNDADNYLYNNSIDYDKHLLLQSYNRDTFNRFANLAYMVNIDEIFCRNNKCFIGENGMTYYRDINHVSTYANQIMLREISSIIK